MTPSPFDRLLMELQLLGRPEDKEALAFLEEYIQWRETGGPKAFEAKRLAQLKLDSANYDRIYRWSTKRK
jgi:hypothetical protein